MKVKDVLKEQEELEEVLHIYKKRLRELSQSLDSFIRQNKVYEPIECLKKYKNKDVNFIILVDNSNKDYVYSNGEIMEIDENGNFYFSDYKQGIVEYEKDSHYHWHFHFSDEDLGEIVGIRMLQLSDSEDFEISPKKLLEKYLDRKVTVKKEKDCKTKIKSYYE